MNLRTYKTFKKNIKKLYVRKYYIEEIIFLEKEEL